MFKRDPIFWWASGIFILVLVLYAVTQYDVLLMLIVFAYLLRPTLASLGVAKKNVDERQMSLNYRSSNIAFVVTIIACILMSAKLRAENNVAAELFFMVIILGVVAKALFNVLLTKDFREVAPKISISVGFFVALFAGISNIDHGIFSLSFIMNVLPGLVMIGIGIISKYFPRIASILILLLCLAFIVWRIIKVGFEDAFGILLIIGVPLLAASYGLWREPKIASDERIE
ncbi:hypothetical protein HQ585_12955 [candidate division KSB1 bacterium]|nr:hypothetical protein [candidate division KSB1 bacterium]